MKLFGSKKRKKIVNFLKFILWQQKVALFVQYYVNLKKLENYKIRTSFIWTSWKLPRKAFFKRLNLWPNYATSESVLRPNFV